MRTKKIGIDTSNKNSVSKKSFKLKNQKGSANTNGDLLMSKKQKNILQSEIKAAQAKKKIDKKIKNDVTALKQASKPNNTETVKKMITNAPSRKFSDRKIYEDVSYFTEHSDWKKKSQAKKDYTNNLKRDNERSQEREKRGRTGRSAKYTKKRVSFQADRMGAASRSTMRSFKNDLSTLTSKDKTDMCQLIPDRSRQQMMTQQTKVRRIVKEHPFFKYEDPTFMAIIQKNLNDFCFNTYIKQEGLDESEGDNHFYYKYCLNIIDYCIKTPPLFYEVISDAISEEVTYKAFFEKSNKIQKQIVRRISKAYEDEIKLNQEQQESNKATLNKLQFEKEAFVLSKLSEEVKYHISRFIVDVFLKSFVEYKEKGPTADKKRYTGKIKMEPHIIKLVNKILKSEGKSAAEGNANAKPNATAQGNAGAKPNNQQVQSGGSNSEMSLENIKKITPEELAEKLSSKQDNLKSDFDNKLLADSDAADEENYGLDAGSIPDSETSTLAAPWFLYVIIGGLVITTTIELGLFDAPPCLSHTFI